MLDNAAHLSAGMDCESINWPRALKTRQSRRKTVISAVLFLFVIICIGHSQFQPQVKRDVELESLIDVLFSVDNVSAVVNYSANGILHRNVHPLPLLNASRLDDIYHEKYRFKEQQKSFTKDTACPGMPLNISKQVPVYQEYAPLPMLESLGFDLKHGGSFDPPCKINTKTAVIIPYRNRDVHLSVWLLHLHPFLQKQNLDYTVFVVNQVTNGTFNKGVIMNSGFMEIAKLDKFDCFVFHDVDLLPEDDRILYTCDKNGIKHLAYALEEWNYKLLYQSLVGGVVAVTWQDYLRLNGFSNQYFGWGGEDDDFYVRISQNKLDIIRYPLAISRYTMVQHHRDAGNGVNQDRYKLLRESVTTNMHQRDGLNNLVYKVESIDKHPLFTQINISFDADKVRKAKPKTINFPYLTDIS